MGLLDQIEQSRRGLLDNVAQKQLERGLLAPRMQRRTPGSSPEERIAQGPIGQWADKVMSGGYLRENVDRWNAAMENSKAQAFDGAPDTGEGTIMDYFAPMAMTAYHGSPHLFDKFSLDKIGTGEGAQAYGHGLYFAENPKVAGEYRDALSGTRGKGLTPIKTYLIDGKRVTEHEFTPKELSAVDEIVNRYGGNSDTAFNSARKTYEQGVIDFGKSDKRVKKFREYLDQLGEYYGKKIEIDKGHLYEVDIPDEHVKNFLDWDAPIGEQKHIVDAIKPSKNDLEWYRISKRMNDIASDPKGGQWADEWDKLNEARRNLKEPDIDLRSTGERFYNDDLMKKFDDYNSSASGLRGKRISDHLNSLGIKGIKYFDGTSRKAGEGTRNLVVFDDSIVKTLKRNNEPVGLLDDSPEFLKRQSGLAEQDYIDTDKMPEMLKRQSGSGGLLDDADRAFNFNGTDYYQTESGKFFEGNAPITESRYLSKLKSKNLREEATGQRFGLIDEADTDYRIAHTAPAREGANSLDDMSDIFPDDIYNPSVAGNYYGHGEKALDDGTAKIISKLRGNPDAEVTMYRAVPKGVKKINKGDWVTINKDYARTHGESWVDDGQYDIIEKKVKAKDLVTDGNSIHEFGYSPD